MWQVARHSISEELTVYPELGKHLGEAGNQMAESDRAEHQVRLSSLQNRCSSLTRSVVCQRPPQDARVHGIHVGGTHLNAQ